jgi:hypothetical protein
MKLLARSGTIIVGAVLLLFAAVLPSTPSASALTSWGGTPLVAVQKIGSPAWAPADLHVFAAPVGTAAHGYAKALKTGETILPPPHYKPNPTLGIGPGTPERPPYTHDLADGINKAGYPGGPLFLPSQYSKGVGVFLAYMVVPSITSRNFGSSPDFTRGPIIPNSLFPIRVSGVAYRDGAVYDPNLAGFSVPALNTIVPPFAVDGSSHFPIFIFDNNESAGQLGTSLPGLYRYQLTMEDSSGNGWNITAFFVVL